MVGTRPVQPCLPQISYLRIILRSALREDPDVIMVDELQDLETMSLALTAAEAGHLVFATLLIKINGLSTSEAKPTGQ